jgi:hypothetical protein
VTRIVEILTPLENGRRDEAIRHVLVGIRAELYRRDVVGGRQAWEGIAEDDRTRPGSGAHAKGPGGRTEREPRHKGPGPHGW